MAMAGLKTIIVLSFILAIGFLLVILSSTLYDSFLPLLVVATYVVAPLPNWLCGKAQSADDFMDNGSSSIVELGRFITGFLVVMGIGRSTLAGNVRYTRERRRG
nr:vacuolar protein sorting-associated protein 55 [Quercus suber]